MVTKLLFKSLKSLGILSVINARYISMDFMVSLAFKMGLLDCNLDKGYERVH